MLPTKRQNGTMSESVQNASQWFGCAPNAEGWDALAGGAFSASPPRIPGSRPNRKVACHCLRGLELAECGQQLHIGGLPQGLSQCWKACPGKLVLRQDAQDQHIRHLGFSLQQCVTRRDFGVSCRADMCHVCSMSCSCRWWSDRSTASPFGPLGCIQVQWLQDLMRFGPARQPPTSLILQIDM